MKLVVCLMGLVLMSCGSGTSGPKGASGKSCSVSKSGSIATVTCPDGSVTILDGTNGINGVDGLDGVNGIDGTNGTDGQNGLDGTNGTSCSVEESETGATISCDDGTSVEIANGTNGLNGESGSQGEAGLDGTDGENGNNGSNGTNGTNGHNVVFTTTSFGGSGHGCYQGHGGYTLSFGLDLNDNGVLNSSEATSAINVCNG